MRRNGTTITDHINSIKNIMNIKDIFGALTKIVINNKGKVNIACIIAQFSKQYYEHNKK
jgi:hypothetical protein